MSNHEQRQAQLAYVAELFVTAFYSSRNVGRWEVTTEENYRATAVTAGARIILSAPEGGEADDLNSVREVAAASLAAQDFQHVAVSLFLDDLVHDSVELAREMRKVSSR